MRSVGNYLIPLHPGQDLGSAYFVILPGPRILHLFTLTLLPQTLFGLPPPGPPCADARSATLQSVLE